MIRYVAPLVCLLSGFTVELSREVMTSFKEDAVLNEKEKLAIAKSSLLNYWQQDLTESETWKQNFADFPWKNIKHRVRTEISNFENFPDFKKISSTGNNVIYTSRVFGLANEVTVSPTGKVTRIYVEMN